jgi:hypothetical protein
MAFHFHLRFAAAETDTVELQKRGNESAREQIQVSIDREVGVLTTDQAMRRKAEWTKAEADRRWCSGDQQQKLKGGNMRRLSDEWELW